MSDRQRLVEGQAAAAKAIREALALDQLHDQNRHAAVGVLQAVERGDAGVVQGGEDAGFLPQTGETLRLS